MRKGKIGSRPSSSSSLPSLLMGTGWRPQNSWRIFFFSVLFLVLITTALMLDQLVKGARTHSVELVKSLPAGTAVSETIIGEELGGGGLSHGIHGSAPHLLSVRDIVSFPDEVMLLVSTTSGAGSSAATFLGSPLSKGNVACLFGAQYRTAALTVNLKDDPATVLAVRCEHPPAEALRSANRVATVLFKESNSVLPSAVEYSTNSSWKPLVYESVTEEDSVLLFAKGLVDSKGKPDNFSRRLDSIRCQFGSAHVTSRVRMIAQEVVRCDLPEPAAVARVAHARVSLFVPSLGLLPSVAYFSPPAGNGAKGPRKGREEKRFRVCSCTMLWNQAHFLREWIIYHGFLGMERWYVYDNNSDDDIEEVLGGLRAMNLNATRHPWPWIKTQEAGFSHCAIRARRDCEWVLFTDVDEFVYPVDGLHRLVYGRSAPIHGKGRKGAKSPAVDFSPPDGASPRAWRDAYEATHRKNGTSLSLLGRVIDETVQRGKSMGLNVGEVRIVCHDFAPSGRRRAPEEGVMVGYTCRMQWPKRHKSFLLLDAMSDSLLNVVHHFKLREGYHQMKVNTRAAVVNHYKYQAWEVFQAKFVRRVATYVVDWNEQTALSRDRAPGMGLSAVEPDDWPSRYCEEQDWGLRNFSWNFFRHPETNLLPWQGQPRLDLE